ncbi:MAG TPA: T9SS type A sorting domain-containing protein, partial [Saprospiraceae bacterium]|nr:T9SS type A sorting domain-containing protein [Saprospiraceae bacterium]
MTKRFILLAYLTGLTLSLSAQYKTDTWFFGYLEPGNTDRDTVYTLQLKDNQRIIKPSKTPHSFEASYASISDTAGHLLLYTNGCMIADSSNNIIPNGDGLNPGPMASELCGHYGYISEQGAAFIPVPGHPNDFWLIHMAVERDTLLKTKYGPLYATYIDGSNGNYAVTIKNQILLEGNLERFAVVKHGNGVDWWITVPKYNTNEYYNYLITKNGIENVGEQKIGPIFHFKYCSNGRGTNTFSNTGKYYVRYNVSCGPVVFNFDRCTGVLDDPLSYVPTQTEFGGGGVAFYPDDSKMYYSTQNFIRKIDLVKFPTASIQIIGYDSTAATTLGDMFIGPDLNAYIRTQSSGFYIHELELRKNGINKTEETFHARAIKLPVRNTRTIPMCINYNLAHKYNSECDSLFTTTKQINNAFLSVYPNPAQSKIILDIGSINQTGQAIELKVLNEIGDIIVDKAIEDNPSTYTLNIAGWVPGLYILQVNCGKKV